jgi:hypothetical protein
VWVDLLVRKFTEAQWHLHLWRGSLTQPSPNGSLVPGETFKLSLRHAEILLFSPASGRIYANHPPVIQQCLLLGVGRNILTAGTSAGSESKTNLGQYPE